MSQKNSKARIINNLLDKESFLEVKKFIMSPRCDWRFLDFVASKEDYTKGNKNGYFIHSFKDINPATNEDRFPESPKFHLMLKILEKMKFNKLLRIRCSLFPRRDVQERDEYHIDYPFPHTTGIYYLNTNNGYTMFENVEKIPSVENQFAIFNGSEKHCTVVQTDTPARYIINFNVI